MMETRVGER
jgi:hypothetical protein